MRPWSSTNDLNVRPLVPKTSALPTAPVLDNKYIITFYLTKSQIKIINQIADRAAIYSAGLYRDKSLTNPFTFRRGTFCLPYGSRPQLSYSKEKGNNTNNERRRYTILAIKLFSISKSRKHHEQVENNSFPWSTQRDLNLRRPITSRLFYQLNYGCILGLSYFKI